MALPSAPGFFHRAGHALVTALHAAAPVLLVLGAAGVVGWLLWGRGLTGSRRARRLGVPILALAAAFCVLGPGHLFPKRYEGPELLKVSASHALTALDVLGLARVRDFSWEKCAAGTVDALEDALRRRGAEIVAAAR